MSAPFRIMRLPQQSTGEQAPSEPVKKYIDGLVKLIPAEVVALYLFGRNAITSYYPPAPAAQPTGFFTETLAWVVWGLACLGCVILTRRIMTSDDNATPKVPVEWPAVVIACVSFVIWVYSFGDAFRILNVWDPLVGTLLVALWTFLAPVIYSPK